MGGSENTSNQPAKFVQPIKSVVDRIIGSLAENRDFVSALKASVREKLSDETVLNEFSQWLAQLDTQPDSIGSWIKLLRSGKVEDAVCEHVAVDCLQMVVLAYLPGPRYFQGVYIASKLHPPSRLKEMKQSLWVPHLNGAVGWMTACFLHPVTLEEAGYVALQDAQVDLRGRVAVSDLWLGNRSVAGFPVGVGAGRQDLTSISGFVFLSHPLRGIFPDPIGINGHANNITIRNALRAVRQVHESTLATAIESYLLRRYGRSVLKASDDPSVPELVPLLAWSGNDPTGFLASILFESDLHGRLRADCHVNENSFLEAAAQYLRFASIFPGRWS